MNAIVNSASTSGTAFTQADLWRAWEVSAQRGKPLIETLEEDSGLSAREFMARLGATLDYPILDMDDMLALLPAFDILPYTEALRHECILFRDAAGVLLLAFVDPFSGNFMQWAGARINDDFSFCLAHRGEIAAFLARHEENLRAIDHVLPAGQGAGSGGRTTEDLSLKSINEDSSPVVKLVNSTLYDALKTGASDIHMETSANVLVIKYRIDGVLTLVGTFPGLEHAEQVISRIKVMADLDIAERRVPQDGRFKVSMRSHEVDFRVSIMPSIFGEDAVLRILDKQTLSDQVKGLSLEHLGFDTESIRSIRSLARKPYGMMLITGPTGSGKTTTLYAAISEINDGQDKIVTIEDPVEYQLPGILQIPVNEKKGLTFARGLRSILRHDPDKIMIGEIRDAETAQIAVQSALTGHLVFTSVHANSVFDVIGRFSNMGVDPYNFVSALNGIVAQRLLRTICPHCATDDHPQNALIEESGLSPQEAGKIRFRAGKGCGRCRGSGYKGRKAIAELLHMNDEIRELIVVRAPTSHIKEAARRNGTRFLRETAIALVECGETTLQEINRVTLVA